MPFQRLSRLNQTSIMQDGVALVLVGAIVTFPIFQPDRLRVEQLFMSYLSHAQFNLSFGSLFQVTRSDCQYPLQFSFMRLYLTHLCVIIHIICHLLSLIVVLYCGLSFSYTDLSLLGWLYILLSNIVSQVCETLLNI